MTIMEALPQTVCHSLHEKHELRLVTTRPSGFVCNGCKQFGQGPEHYRCECEECDFDLHARCATAPAFVEHALFNSSSSSRFTLLSFRTTHDGDIFCHACGVESAGLRYHNPDLHLYLHPCCAFLPKHVFQDGPAFDLRNDAFEVRSFTSSRKCRLCKERPQTRSLSYRCTYRDGGHVYLHVRCLVKAHNKRSGHNNWRPSAPIMEGVLGTFTRKRDAAKAYFGAGKIALTVTGIAASVVGLAEKADVISL